MTIALRVGLVGAVALCVSVPLRGQTLPSEPIVLGGGHLTVGGDVSASFGSDDTGAYFNFTDYEHSTVRMLRLDLSAALNAGDHVSVLTDIRVENRTRPAPYALYVRLRPWANRSFDIQAGRVPPTFGGFARRTYPTDNLLIGYPLAYQYLTSLRPDSLPADADELLRMRARGWSSGFSVGNTTPARGVPLMSAFQWDTGVQAHAAGRSADATVSVTTGTISNPRFRDDNSGRQLAGRIAVHPTAGLVIGTSAARGQFVADSAARSAVGTSTPDDLTQTAWGADLEFSRDYYLVRVETILSRWTLPRLGTPVIGDPLSALATYVEGRYKIRPGLYAAARLDHLGFSEVTGTGIRDTWEAPVTRVELGGGYSIQRNLVLKGTYQHNSRLGGRVRETHVGAAQLLFWF